MRERAKRLAARTVLLTAMTVVPAQMLAVPAKPVRRVVTMTDGTKVEATLQGDEHLHFFRLDDGRVALPQDGGRCRVATEREVGVVWTERMAEARKRQSNRLRTANGGELWTPRTDGQYGSDVSRRNVRKANSAYQGQKRGLVILVNFSDLKMSVEQPEVTFRDFFNKEGYNQGGMSGSVHDYFRDQSYGQFDLQFDVVGPVTLNKTHSYYGGDQDGRHDANVHDMVVEACNAVDDRVDFSRYDWDQDGQVDQIFFVYAGYGQNYGAPDDCIWPHEHTIAYRNLRLDGIAIGTYACSCELRGTQGTQPDGIGAACHEFSHCMGIMDHYDTSGDNFGMGDWDVMCSGSYNDSSRTPSAYTAYERWVSGWLEPVEINKATYVQGMKPLEDEPEAYVLYNDYNRNEFYLLENRQQKGWDAAQDGHGLLVVHVDYDERTWYTNQINVDATHQRMTIIPADGSLSGSNQAGDPWPGTVRKSSLTDTSSPAAAVYTEGPDGYAFMGKPLTDITEDEARGLVSFACMRGALPTPVLGEVTDITDTSFSLSWGDVEGATSYEISMREKPAPYATPEQACVVNEDFAKCWSKSSGLGSIGNKLDQYTTAPGWTGTNVYTSPKYLKMGAGSKMGTLITPQLDTPLADGITIVMTLEPYTENTTLSGSVIIKLKSGTMTGTFNVEGKKTLIFSASEIAEPFQLSIEPAQVGCISRLSVYDGEFSAEQLGITDGDGGEEDAQSIMSGTSRRAVKHKVGTTTTYTTTQSHYTFTGLNSTSKYYVTVRALTDLGPSKWSLEREVRLDQTAVRNPAALPADGSDTWYDLQGRRLPGRPQPGLYIHDGRKVMVR